MFRSGDQGQGWGGWGIVRSYTRTPCLRLKIYDAKEDIFSRFPFNENQMQKRQIIVINSPFDRKIGIGKKVEVSPRLFDIFERNRVFIFSLGSWESPPTE